MFKKYFFLSGPFFREVISTHNLPEPILCKTTLLGEELILLMMEIREGIFIVED
jgi:hypothetical protein